MYAISGIPDVPVIALGIYHNNAQIDKNFSVIQLRQILVFINFLESTHTAKKSQLIGKIVAQFKIQIPQYIIHEHVVSMGVSLPRIMCVVHYDPSDSIFIGK